MKKLEILVDIDEVLNNLLERWVACLNEKYGVSANMEDKNTWRLNALYPTLTDDEIDSPLFDNAFWASLETRPYSVEYLHKLISDGHDVSIVTATHVYQTIPAKMDWLFRHYPYLSWDNIILAKKKQRIRGDVLIDDAIHNLEGGSYIKLLHDSPYNRNYEAGNNGMIRVYNLMDAYNVINNL